MPNFRLKKFWALRHSIFFVLLPVLALLTACKIQKQDTKYNTDLLSISTVAPDVFCHVSYLQTESFGNVACNGMVVIYAGEALIFDTPTNDAAADELINWLENVKKVTVKGVVITHFHEDCLGGIKAFHSRNIPSYAHNKTIALTKLNGLEQPQNGFEKSLELTVGNRQVINSFIGEGHTTDNIISYYPAEKVMFGGCLIKTNGATKGYLGDANVMAWSATVEQVRRTYPDATVVIPGHGAVGGTELLDYTVRLFKTKQ